jgi:shikimate kinase
MNLIVLAGPKHSGKSSAGRALAKRLGVPFFDLDSLIEDRSGRSPRDLYREAPELFRKHEAEALKILLAAPRNPEAVLAAGGGIIDNADAMAQLRTENIFILYLEISAETAWKRIASGEIPPFLQDTGETPQEAHRKLHERRNGAYREKASSIIYAEGKTPEEIAEEAEAVLAQTEKF